MAKWSGYKLSTTETYNHIGQVNIRQGNFNSESFQFQILENNLPYDLSNKKVYFATTFSGDTTVEEAAQIIDPLKGMVQFTFSPRSTQEIGSRNAYFEIYEGNRKLDTTQDFTYYVKSSIMGALIDGESYIQRLEDLIKLFEEKLKEMNDWQIDGMKEFLAWFESIKAVLESIDPGGLLLKEVIEARDSERFGKFDYLDARLENIEKYVYEYVPSGFTILIKHNLTKTPKIACYYYEDALGTEITGFNTTKNFGGTIPEDISVKATNSPGISIIELPGKYTQNGQFEYHDNVAMLIDGNKTLNFTFDTGTAISDGEVIQTNKLPTPQDLSGNFDEAMNNALLKWRKNK